jgi:hypothetical protein
MKVVNKLGLEAEFLLRDSKGNFRYPAKHGFSTDDFFLLGELRASPGKTREECVGNFMQAVAEVLYKAEKKNFLVDFSGMAEISPSMKSDVLRKMNSKQIPAVKNIYGTDILNLSDDVVESGTITLSRISCGLHIHFSREMFHEWKDENKLQKTESKSILTESQRKSIIMAMDSKILPLYSLRVPLKYRRAGFYEQKPYGFEYRSLPMIKSMTSLEEIMKIVDFAFLQLEKLEK